MATSLILSFKYIAYVVKLDIATSLPLLPLLHVVVIIRQFITRYVKSD